jgi:hypothetical protein
MSKKAKDRQDKDQCVQVNLVSKQKLEQLTSKDKLRFIIDEVKRGNILVLEHGLTAFEQTELIKKTMEEIKEDTFIGIEMEGYKEETPTLVQKIFRLIKKPRMTLIGPADLLQTVSKDNEMIQTKIIPGKGL